MIARVRYENRYENVGYENHHPVVEIRGFHTYEKPLGFHTYGHLIKSLVFKGGVICTLPVISIQMEEVGAFRSWRFHIIKEELVLKACYKDLGFAEGGFSEIL